MGNIYPFHCIYLVLYTAQKPVNVYTTTVISFITVD